MGKEETILMDNGNTAPGSPTGALHHEHHPVTLTKSSDDSLRTLAEHGPVIDHQIPQADARESNPALRWGGVRRHMQDAFSEFLGTFIILMFGDGVVAQVVLSRGEKGSYQSISWGWG